MKKHKLDIETTKLISDYSDVVFKLFDIYKGIYLAEKSIHTLELDNIITKFNSDDGIGISECNYLIEKVDEHNLRISILINKQQNKQ